MERGEARVVGMCSEGEAGNRSNRVSEGGGRENRMGSMKGNHGGGG